MIILLQSLFLLVIFSIVGGAIAGELGVLIGIISGIIVPVILALKDIEKRINKIEKYIYKEDEDNEKV